MGALSVMKDQKPFMIRFEEIAKELGLNEGIFAYALYNDGCVVIYHEPHVSWLFNCFLKSKGYYD